MSLQFIIGGSGSGKTRRLYEELIDQAVREPEGRFFAIVPEQFTMQTQKDIVTLHPCHGVMNIDIVSFERLAYRIFEELAVENLAVLDDMGKAMVLRKVAAGKKKELKLFGGHLDKIGFIGELKSMMSEFFQYGVTAEVLEGLLSAAEKEGLSAMLRQKLNDMALLHRAFKEYTDERKCIVKEEILEILCRVLPNSELIQHSVVTLDGYTGFTPVQYRLLELLLIYCRRVVVTITMDPEENPYREAGPQHLFHMSSHTVCKLTKLAEQTGAGREEDILLKEIPAWRFRRSPELQFIEKELFRYHGNKYVESAEASQNGKLPSKTGLVLFKADTPLKEVEMAAGEIERLIKQEGYRYRDIAVVTGALDGYSREIVRRFEANLIPAFIDYKKNIMENPMVELLRAVLEVLQKNFSYESMFRYLKTGLVTEEQEMVSRLENYVLALGIRSFRRWDTVWDAVYRGAELINLEELNEFRERILSPLRPLREVFGDRKSTVREKTKALVCFMEALHIEEKLLHYEKEFQEAGEVSLQKEYGQVYGLVIEQFDRLTALLGEEAMGKKEYSDILDAGFGEIKVGLIPAVVDRVVVGDITRTRLSHIKILFFVGVNDGIVPAVPGRGGILTEAERKNLKSRSIELAPTVREEGFLQRMYLYMVMTKPSDRLYLSYAAASSDGKGLRPSGLISQVLKMFPGKHVLRADEGQMAAWSLPVGKRRVIEGLRDYGKNKEDSHFMELLRFFSCSGAYRKEMETLVEASFYSYEGRGIGRTAAREIYSQILHGSVTRMEQYASCAYAHFLAYGLELSERPLYELAAADIGNLFHSSIDLYFKRMKEENRSFRDIEDEDRKKLVAECVGEVTGEYGNTIMSSSARNRYLEQKVRRITDRTVWALTQQLKKGDFEPSGFEVTFSPADNLKAMKIPISREEAIHLRGRIDRVDLCEDGDRIYLKIIDYKTGKTKFDILEAYYGIQLQLVVYMDAALEKEQRKHTDKKVVPAGIFYYNIADPMVERTKGMGEDETKQAILKELRMNGLVNASPEAVAHLDNRLDFSSSGGEESYVIPVSVKNQEVVKKAAVAGEKRFAALGSFVNRKLKKMGQEILEGRIQASPFKSGNKTACDFCPYHSVCGFDLKTEGYGYRRFDKLRPEEIWQEIDKAGEDEFKTERSETEDGNKLDEGTEGGN